MATDLDVVNAALNKLGEQTLTLLTDPSRPGRLANSTYTDIRDALLREFAWNFATQRAEIAVNATAPAWGFKRRYEMPSTLLRLIEVNNLPAAEWRLESGFILTDSGNDLDEGEAQTFAFTDVDTTEDDITIVGHGYDDEEGPFHLTTDGTLPAGTSLLTNYYIEKVDDDTFGLRLTKDGAVVDLTSQGSGTHTITPVSVVQILFVGSIAVDDMDTTFREALAARLAMEWAEPLSQTTSVFETMAAKYRNALRVARVADGQEDSLREIVTDTFIQARF